MVIWIIGKSAAGKTSVAESLVNLLRSTSDEAWVHLDGDTLRQIQTDDSVDHTIAGRKKNSQLAVNFCKFLDGQEINVIASILSIFEEDRSDLSQNVKSYKEIYLKVDDPLLIHRDNKHLYEKALSGEIKNFVGVDIKFPEPPSPHLVINNDGSLSIAEIAHEIYEFCFVNTNITYEYSYPELIEFPQKYQYTKFDGHKFLDRYAKHRMDFLDIGELSSVVSLLELKERVKNLEPSIIGLEESNYLQIKEIILNLDQDSIFNLIRSFEVHKRIYCIYDAQFKSLQLDDYHGNLGYLLTSFLISKFLLNVKDQHSSLKLINALCKLNDILIPLSSTFSALESEIAKISVSVELRMIELLHE